MQRLTTTINIRLKKNPTRREYIPVAAYIVLPPISGR